MYNGYLKTTQTNKIMSIIFNKSPTRISIACRAKKRIEHKIYFTILIPLFLDGLLSKEDTLTKNICHISDDYVSKHHQSTHYLKKGPSIYLSPYHSFCVYSIQVETIESIIFKEGSLICQFDISIDKNLLPDYVILYQQKYDISSVRRLIFASDD